MWGAIAGGLMAIGGAAYNAITGKKMAEEDNKTLNRMEANANNAYYSSIGRSRALMENALARSRNAVMEGIKRVNDTSGVTGGDPNATAKLQEQYLETASKEAQQGADREVAANLQAEQLLAQQKQSIEQSRMAVNNARRQSTAAAAGEVAKAGAQIALGDINKGLNNAPKAPKTDAPKTPTEQTIAEQTAKVNIAPDAPIKQSPSVQSIDSGAQMDMASAYGEDNDFFGLTGKKGYYHG